MDERWVHIIAVFSFVGGPLYLADLWKPALGDPWSFVAAFVPLGLMAFGMTFLRDDPKSWLVQRVILFGALGAWILIMQHLYAAGMFLLGEQHKDMGLITCGIVVGLLAAFWYVHNAFQFSLVEDKP